MDNTRNHGQITHTNLCLSQAFHTGLEITMPWVPCGSEMKVMYQGHCFICFFIAVTKIPVRNNLWRKTVICTMALQLNLCGRGWHGFRSTWQRVCGHSRAGSREHLEVQCWPIVIFFLQLEATPLVLQPPQKVSPVGKNNMNLQGTFHIQTITAAE